MICLVPVAVDYARVRPAWDELYFLHRAVCVNRAVFAADPGALDLCFKEMSKSPILATLLLPAGPIAAAPERLALAPTMLALACFGQVLVLLRLIAASGMRWPVAAAAAAVAGLAVPLRIANAPFLVDGLLALVVANTFMLLLAEAAGPRSDGAFRRGMLWGFVLGCGILSKLTFLYFAALCVVPAIMLSLRQAGLAASVRKLLGALLIGAIPTFLLLRYADGFKAHAAGAAFGNLATFYDDGLSRWEFLPRAFESLGLIYLTAVALLTLAVLVCRGGPLRILVAAWLLTVLAGYLWVASGSANKDPRFFWPVWVALPFSIAAAFSAGPPRRLPGAAMAAAAALAVALSLPAAGRQDLAAVMEADALLGTLPGDRPIRVLLASDEPSFNIETMLLGRELHFDRLSRLSLDTVVYDVIHGRTLEQSIARLRAADVVIIRDPPEPGAPEWANRFLPRLLEAMRDACSEPTRIGRNTLVFRDCRS
jgi:hypothetical protein